MRRLAASMCKDYSKSHLRNMSYIIFTDVTAGHITEFGGLGVGIPVVRCLVDSLEG